MSPVIINTQQHETSGVRSDWQVWSSDCPTGTGQRSLCKGCGQDARETQSNTSQP